MSRNERGQRIKSLCILTLESLYAYKYFIYICIHEENRHVFRSLFIHYVYEHSIQQMIQQTFDWNCCFIFVAFNFLMNTFRFHFLCIFFITLCIAMLFMFASKKLIPIFCLAFQILSTTLIWIALRQKPIYILFSCTRTVNNNDIKMTGKRRLTI